LSHIEQCAAIAEIEAEMESGETAENSLFAVPEGKSHVQSTMMFFNDDLCPDAVTQGFGRGRDKESKDTKEERKKERRRKEQEEAASAALLSLNPRKCGKVEGVVL
jgi:hypothetical protein